MWWWSEKSFSGLWLGTVMYAKTKLIIGFLQTDYFKKFIIFIFKVLSLYVLRKFYKIKYTFLLTVTNFDEIRFWRASTFVAIDLDNSGQVRAYYRVVCMQLTRETIDRRFAYTWLKPCQSPAHLLFNLYRPSHSNFKSAIA